MTADPPAPALPFEALFNASANPYMVLDRNLIYVAVNAAYLRATGSRREDLLGNHVFNSFPAQDASTRPVRESFDRVLRLKAQDTIALIHYPLQTPDGAIYDSWWTAIHTPVLDDEGEVAFILQHTVDVTALQPDHATIRSEAAAELIAKDLFRRAQEVQAKNLTLTANFNRLRQLFVQAPGFMCVLRGPDHVFEFVNDAYIKLVGRTDLIGRSTREALPEVATQGFVDLLDRVRRTGEPWIGSEAPVKLTRGDRVEDVFVDFIYQPLIESDGTVSGILVQGSDVTERVRGQQRQRLMIDELNHRVKNTLATVQSIAQQTLRAAPDMAAFSAAFEARLLALSQTHNALTRGNWQGADLHDILQGELAPYGLHRITLTGPQATLGPRTALALGLVFHELATNAAKYGALSVSEGRLSVTWRLALSPNDAAPDRYPAALILAWREADGPRVGDPPRTAGFGSRLIQRSVERELDGRVQLVFDPDGFQAEIAVPLASEPSP